MGVCIQPGQSPPTPGQRPFFCDPPNINGRVVDGIRTTDQIRRVARTIGAYPVHRRMGLLQACKRRVVVLRQNQLITPGEMRSLNAVLLPVIAQERRRASLRQSESPQKTQSTPPSTQPGSSTDEPPSSTGWGTGAEQSTTSLTEKLKNLISTK